jgi:intein-encoded DNA endonuclease-like protein
MRTSSFPAWDKALDGRLGDILGDLRSEGLSFEAIAFRLRHEHGITVSSATVRRWCLEAVA